MEEDLNKICGFCDNLYPVTAFYKANTADGYSHKCISCSNKKVSWWKLILKYLDKLFPGQSLKSMGYPKVEPINKELSILKAKYNCCLACGSTEKLAAHYIIPIWDGGKKDISNMQLLCESCVRRGLYSTDYRYINDSWLGMINNPTYKVAEFNESRKEAIEEVESFSSSDSIVMQIMQGQKTTSSLSYKEKEILEDEIGPDWEELIKYI